MSRTEVRSPVRGTVKEIKIRTIGGVIKPGEDLMEIVPIEDTLLVEAQVRTSDIAFIHTGQQATVKFDTYDFSIYGGLKATVEYISIDAIEDQSSGKKERYFRVRLRTDKNFLGTEAKPLPIGPGYTATAEILTDKKTVLGLPAEAHPQGPRRRAAGTLRGSQDVPGRPDIGGEYQQLATI